MNEKQKKLLSENYDYIEEQIKKYTFIPPRAYDDCKSYVLYRICQRIDVIDEDKAKSHLFVMVRSLVYNYFKETTVDPIVNENQIVSDNSLDYWIDRKNEEIKEAINELDSTNQHIILLYYFDGLTEVEIGAILGISHQAISKRLHKALDKLRPILKEKIDRLDEIRSNL